MPKDEQLPTDTVESLGRYLPERVTVPADKTEVTQYLEGSLALSVKDPPFLEPYVFFNEQPGKPQNHNSFLRLFQTFPRMDPTVQEVVQELLVRPIQAIGPNNPRLLGYLKNYPEGAETLVLKILNVFTDGMRPAPSIIGLVKTLLADRGADARFLMFIISEMDKVNKIRRSSFRTTLNKSITPPLFPPGRDHPPPPETGGNIEWDPRTKRVGSPNVHIHHRDYPANKYEPDPRRTEQASCTKGVDDPVARHGIRSRPEKGERRFVCQSLFSLMEGTFFFFSFSDFFVSSAISICFNLPDIFKSEVLVSVMQHYLDAKTLPMLFVWTVRTFGSLY